MPKAKQLREEVEAKGKKAINARIQHELKGLDVQTLEKQAADLAKLAKMFGEPVEDIQRAKQRADSPEERVVKKCGKLMSQALTLDGSDAGIDAFYRTSAEITADVAKITQEQEKPTSKISSEKMVDKALKLADKIEILFTALQPYLKMAQPINNWRDIDENTAFDLTPPESILGKWKSDIFFTQDITTGDLYCDDSTTLLRKKLFLLSLGTCTINLIALLAFSMYRLAKIITLYELRNPTNSNIQNLKNYGADIARLVFGPLILLGMQITAVLGTITPATHGPRDARKMYALGESLLFGFSNEVWRLAPCFKPNPTYHLFGGEIGKKNQW